MHSKANQQYVYMYPFSLKLPSHPGCRICKSKLQWDNTSHQLKWLSSKNPQTINAGEGMEKRETPCTVGGNVNWSSHCGEKCGGSLKKQKQNYHMTPQSHSWAYIQRTTGSEGIHVPHCSLQHCLQQSRHRSNLNVYMSIESIMIFKKLDFMVHLFLT